MVRITDLEPDGEPDIIVGALYGHLIRYDANFEQRWMYPAVAHGTSELRFADLLPTDGLEVLAGSHYGRLYVLTAQEGIESPSPRSATCSLTWRILTRTARLSLSTAPQPGR